MNIVVPMAGRGSRFADVGVSTPKPLIDVAGQPMVWWALQSLKNIPRTRTICVALKEHDDQHGIAARLRDILGADTEVVLLDDVTNGQLCTVLEARAWIDRDEDVLIANCDTVIESELGTHIATKSPDCHGIISVASMPGDRWSFARTDESGRVVEVTEKVRISDHASTGYYYFSSGRDLCAIGDDMIRRGETTRGEYYVIPVYQKLIEAGQRVEISPVDAMWDMGTPSALAAFEAHLRE